MEFARRARLANANAHQQLLSGLRQLRQLEEVCHRRWTTQVFFEHQSQSAVHVLELLE